MINLTFYAVPLFFRHQKDSGSWSIHKGENFSNESCILGIAGGESDDSKFALQLAISACFI